jgi:hypothetical protein
MEEVLAAQAPDKLPHHATQVGGEGCGVGLGLRGHA